MIKEAHVAVANEPSPIKWPVAVMVAALLMVGGSYGLTQALTPTRVMADELPALNLEQDIPKQFGDWRLLDNGPAVVVDPTVEATLAEFYSQTIGRSYVNSKGQLVMLSLAYGKNQNSFNTAAHRPEFCYAAQGYLIKKVAENAFALKDHSVIASRLVATRVGSRHNEPISYWVTLDDTTALPGLSRRIQQFKYGLQGKIVDGFLVRISSLGADNDQQFEVHEQFARDLEQAIAPSLRPRLFGLSGSHK